MDIAAIAASSKRKAYMNIVFPLFIISIIAFVDRVNIGYAALTMNKDLGFTAQMFGLGAGIFFAGYVLFEIPGALLAEKYSPRMWIARIMITWGIVSGLMAFMTEPWEFYTIRFLLGAAEASLYPVIYATCIPRFFSAQERPRAIALLLTSTQFSNIIGAPLAGWLIGVPLYGLKGWQGLFVLEPIPAVIFGVIAYFWLADRPSQASWLNEDEKKYLTERFEKEVAAKAAVKHYSVLQAFSDKKVLKLCVTYFLWITGFWGFNYWMPSVLKAASGWSNMAIGWLVVPPMVISMIVMIWIGHSSSKTGEKRWHGASGMFIAAVGMLVGTMVSDATISYLCVCVVGIGVYMPFGVWWAYPTTFLSGSAAAGAIGLINSFGNIGGFVGPYVTGFLKDLTGTFTSAWIYLAFSMVLSGLLILTLKNEVPTDKVK